MEFKPSDVFPEVVMIEPDVFEDDRGFFLETYQREHFLQYDMPTSYVQDNLSFSKQNVLRGLHYQVNRPQGKLIYVAQGEIFDVAVDIRKGSPTFGKWSSMSLSSKNHLQVYIPPGFAHGYCVLSKTASIVYKCTDYYSPLDERGIIWNDKSLKIEWPVETPIISERDLSFKVLKSIAPGDLPVF